MPRSHLKDLTIRALTLAAVALLLWALASGVQHRLSAQGIRSGFAFLWQRAGYDLSESVIRYDANDSYARALAAGALNTLKVAAAAIVGALVLGFGTAMALISGHPTLAALARSYIRVIRNTPLLLQLFMWYGICTTTLPPLAQAVQPLPGVHISNRGIALPWPDGAAWLVGLLALAALVAGAVLLRRGPVWALGGLAAAVAIVVGARLAGIGTADWPTVTRFSMRGGAQISPEFLTVALGLTVYTATYIAAAIEGAIRAVPRGQTEAARSLGLHSLATLVLVTAPQAIRIATPAVTSELLNLVKNSSLGVAVGYPELVSVGNTAMNQTGQAIELITIYMLFYVTLNVVVTMISQLFEARHAWR